MTMKLPSTLVLSQSIFARPRPYRFSSLLFASVILCSFVNDASTEPFAEPGPFGNIKEAYAGPSQQQQNGLAQMKYIAGRQGGSAIMQNPHSKSEQKNTGQAFPINSYNTAEKYGYDYAIPGAKVHFAANRGKLGDATNSRDQLNALKGKPRALRNDFNKDKAAF